MIPSDGQDTHLGCYLCCTLLLYDRRDRGDMDRDRDRQRERDMRDNRDNRERDRERERPRSREQYRGAAAAAGDDDAGKTCKRSLSPAAGTTSPAQAER